MSLRNVALFCMLALAVGCAPSDGDGDTPAGNGDNGTNTTSAPMLDDVQLVSIQSPSAT